MSSESTLNVDTHTTYDTLYVANKAIVSYGGKGDILVDDGVDVIQKPVGADGQVLTYDTTQAANVTYKPYLFTSNLRLPVQGGITSSAATTYSCFNIRIARSAPTLIDFCTIPYDTVITSIELIPLPTNVSFSWPLLTVANYYQFRMGYETAGAFTQFAPSPNPHFTVGGAVVPIAGVTHFNRSTLFNVVRYVPSTVWNVTAGTKITLQLVKVGSVVTSYYIVMIYLKGNLT